MHLIIISAENNMFLSSLTWSGLQIKDLLEYKNLKHFPPYSGSMLHLARNDNRIEFGIQYDLKFLKQ